MTEAAGPMDQDPAAAHETVPTGPTASSEHATERVPVAGPEAGSAFDVEPTAEPRPTPESAPANDIAPAHEREPASDSAPPAEAGPAAERNSTPPVSTDAAAAALPAMPAVESTRRLLGASFDLIGRSSDDMRRASFYVGVVIVMTVAPVALATWALEVAAVHYSAAALQDTVGRVGYTWYGLLFYPAFAGLVIGAVESRTMAAGVLGSHLIGRPISVRQALARSRMVFWRAVAASIIVFFPVAIAQAILGVVVQLLFGSQVDLSLPTSVVAAVFAAPFGYLLTGIVLGDVGPLEATRRSFRVFRARKIAAVLVVIFETIAVVLVALGLSAGLGLVFPLFDALGVGVESGPAGLALITVGVVVLVFAFGTLLYTALAISIAPQVVMFVGLTHATIGLDHVRAGGRNDPAVVPRGRRRFRWLTRPLLVTFLVALAALGVMLSRLA